VRSPVLALAFFARAALAAFPAWAQRDDWRPDGGWGVPSQDSYVQSPYGEPSYDEPAYDDPRYNEGPFLDAPSDEGPYDLGPETPIDRAPLEPLPQDAYPAYPETPGRPGAQPMPERGPGLPTVREPMPSGIAIPPTLSPDEMIAAVNAAAFDGDADLGVSVPGKLSQNPLVMKLQVLLDRSHLSPGVIDGYYGFNVQKAVAAFEAMNGLPVDGILDADVWRLLDAASGEPGLVSYTLIAADVAGPFVLHLPANYAEMAKLDRLAYRDAAEAIAERTHMDPEFLLQLNPNTDFSSAGAEIIVAAPGGPARVKVTSIVADKTTKQVIGYDSEDRIVVAYPATIGSDALPSPTGRHVVEAVAINPEYWYRPYVNFKQGDNHRPLRLPPGPNGPVGAVWIDLSEPTYGIHGTPNPNQIDKGFSHGCVRLTNWDADELANLVSKGIPVDFLP
jgi:lipoprotein-anchoring transpeptidase ErfK/SrfK